MSDALLAAHSPGRRGGRAVGLAPLPLPLLLARARLPAHRRLGPGVLAAGRPRLRPDQEAAALVVHHRPRPGRLHRHRQVKRRFQRVAVDTKPWMWLPMPTRHGWRVTLHTLEGQIPADYADAAERLAHSWGVHAVRVSSPGPAGSSWPRPSATRWSTSTSSRPRPELLKVTVGVGDRQALGDRLPHRAALAERRSHPVRQVQPRQRPHRRPGPATGGAGRLRPQGRSRVHPVRAPAVGAGHQPRRVGRPAR